MSYPATVAYLYALGNELKPGAKFGLERMRTLLSALGSPEAGQRFVHVAGTNGKGSTCAMIASVLRESGLRTGLNTSPHLIEPTERIQIDDCSISHQEFEAAFELVHAAAERLLDQNLIDDHPSYFETVTAMALRVFRDRCDIGVIEVGLGGRLDATNVISPQLTVVTPIAFDHEAFLGNTVEAIAFEKAGILKSGVPVVVACQLPEAERVLLSRAAELGCPLVLAREHAVTDVVASPEKSSFTFDGESYECPLPGRHQVENTVTAILACKELGVTVDTIQRGLRRTRWPGRLEYVAREPDFVLDGAHNPAGARALAEYINEFRGGRCVWLIYGAMRDKAIDEVTAQLFPLADKLIVTKPDFPRALRPEAILETCEHPNAMATDSVQQAIEIARTAPPDALVFFTGSLYLVGEARRLLLASAPVS